MSMSENIIKLITDYSHPPQVNVKNPILKKLENDFKFLKKNHILKNEKGTRFGYIEFDGNKRLFLDHWKDGNNYMTQWSLKENGYDIRRIGSANKSRSSINVKNNKRDTELKTIAISNGAKSEDVEIFLNEIVELANHLGNKLFDVKKDSIEDDSVNEINRFEDYPDTIKDKAIEIFEDNPLEYFLEVLEKVHFGDENNKILLILSMFTKHVKNGKPVSVIIIGSTESGKTSLANKTAKIIPERYLIQTNSMSAKAAYYHQDTFREDHNHLVINDVLDSPDLIAILKAITDTETNNPKHMTVSDDKKPIEYEVKGKNTVLMTAAQQLTDTELNRRLLHINPDESHEHQIKAKEFIMQKEISGLSKENELEFEICQAITEKIIEEDLNVFVPWLLALDVDPHKKTDLIMISNLVKARACLFRFNREKLDNETILASLDDVLEVLKLWDEIKNMQKTYLPEKAFELVNLLPEWDENKFNNKHYGKDLTELSKDLNSGKSTIRKWVFGDGDQKGLVDLGLIKKMKDGDSSTSPWKFYKIKKGTSSLNHFGNNKQFLNSLDKKRIIESICDLFLIKESNKVINKINLVNSICQKYPYEIKTDEDIIKLCDLVEKELQNY